MRQVNDGEAQIRNSNFEIRNLDPMRPALCSMPGQKLIILWTSPFLLGVEISNDLNDLNG